jgi:hypothetical protein
LKLVGQGAGGEEAGDAAAQDDRVVVLPHDGQSFLSALGQLTPVYSRRLLTEQSE